MPLDTSIPLQVQQPQPYDQMNALMRILQIKGLQDESSLNAIKTQAAQRDFENENSLNQAYKGALGSDGSVDRNALLRALADRNLGSKIPAVQKSFLENDKTQSEVGKNNAVATKDTSEAENKTIAMYRDASQAIVDPQSAVDFVTHMHSDPRLASSAIARVPLPTLLAQIPQDPQQLQAWKQQFALGANKFMELNKPQFITSNTGGQTVTTGVAGLTGQTTPVQTLQNTQSPDNAATNATHVQTTAMTNATSRANNRDTIAGENMRAGVSADGSLTPDMEVTAKAIASGQLQPPSGMALLNPKNQRILARVMEINPSYDSTTVTAKKAAATAFTTGKEGAMMRSLQVAGQHLDQLGQLADAMNNGDLQAVNRIGNFVSQQTGSPAITNFDAAKEVVAKEVMKAIVAGGGGVGEREELARTLSNAKSPQQLKGVITQYRNLMAAQHDALLQQRDAAGLPRSTLPNYTEGSGSPAPGMPTTNAIDAELARRAGKK